MKKILALLLGFTAYHPALADDSVVLLRSNGTYSLVATCLARSENGICENLTVVCTGTVYTSNSEFKDDCSPWDDFGAATGPGTGLGAYLDSPEKIQAYLSKAEKVREWLRTPVSVKKAGLNLTLSDDQTDFPISPIFHILGYAIAAPLDVITSPAQAGIHFGEKVTIRPKIIRAFENVENFVKNQPTSKAPKLRDMFLNVTYILRSPPGQPR